MLDRFYHAVLGSFSDDKVIDVYLNVVEVHFLEKSINSQNFQDFSKLLQHRKNLLGPPKDFCDFPQFSFGGVKEFLR
jgi:hypothetical protein